MIEVRVVDGFDRGIDIRVSSEEHAARERINGARLGEKLAAIHAGHALIADDDGERVAAALELAHGG